MQKIKLIIFSIPIFLFSCTNVPLDEYVPLSNYQNLQASLNESNENNLKIINELNAENNKLRQDNALLKLNIELSDPKFNMPPSNFPVVPPLNDQGKKFKWVEDTSDKYKNLITEHNKLEKDRNEKINNRKIKSDKRKTEIQNQTLDSICSSNNNQILDKPQIFEINSDFYNLMRLKQIWSSGCTGEGSVIAVIDGGFQHDHPDYVKNIKLEVCLREEPLAIQTQDFPKYICPNGKYKDISKGASSSDDESHGTGVAGTVHHIAPGAELILINIGVASGGAGLLSPLRAYEWITQNALEYEIDAVVMSFGSGQYKRDSLRQPSDNNCGLVDEKEYKLFNEMNDEGVVVIAASGNSGFLDITGPPACLDNTVSVGASDHYGNVINYSNTDQELDLLAASEFKVAAQDSKYEQFGGTSQAAPVIAGLIAIGRQINPDISMNELINIARETAYSIDDYVVKDLKLVDFLAFAQELSGLPVTPKPNTKYITDDEVELLTGVEYSAFDIIIRNGNKTEAYKSASFKTQIDGFSNCILSEYNFGKTIKGINNNTSCTYSIGVKKSNDIQKIEDDDALVVKINFRDFNPKDHVIFDWKTKIDAPFDVYVFFDLFISDNPIKEGQGIAIGTPYVIFGDNDLIEVSRVDGLDVIKPKNKGTTYIYVSANKFGDDGFATTTDYRYIKLVIE